MAKSPDKRQAAASFQKFGDSFPGLVEAFQAFLQQWEGIGVLEAEAEKARNHKDAMEAEKGRILADLDAMHRAAADKIAAERKAADEEIQKAQRTHNDIIIRAKTKAEGIVADAAEQAGHLIRQVDGLKAEHLDLSGKIESGKTALDDVQAKVLKAHAEHGRITKLINELRAKL